MKKAQNIVEYILIFSMVGIICYGIAAKIDFSKIRNYVFVRPATQDGANGYKIKIEAMTK